MDDKRTSGVWTVSAVAVLLTLLLGAYVTAYFVRSGYIDESYSDWAVRVFATDTEARIFRPAAKVESFVKRRQVKTSEPLGH